MAGEWAAVSAILGLASRSAVMGGGDTSLRLHYAFGSEVLCAAAAFLDAEAWPSAPSPGVVSSAATTTQPS
jgi:hypothetical protein